MKRLVVAALFLLPSLSWAHGGLPVSESVLRQGSGDTMYVPVAFWGLWIGDGVGPWQWICEEEINPNRARKFALSVDGTFYTNDVRGVTVSNDHGCTWLPATGELATLRTTAVAVHPTDGATAWATTDDVIDDADGGQIVNNALFVTHDHGATFSRLPGLPGVGRRFQSVLPAPSNGDTIYVTSAGPMTPFDVMVLRSDDGGQSFSANPLDFSIGGAVPYSVDLMAIDPRDSDIIYLRAFVTAPDADGGFDPLQVLLRSNDSGASVQEITRIIGQMTPAGTTSGIDGVAIDTTRNKLYVATLQGLMVGDASLIVGNVTLQPTGGLTQAQCVSMHGDAVYACSSNYSPDFAALARSDDGAASFQSVLSYQATEGPIDCPADTPVGQMCPYYWLMYSAQLGINMGLPDGGGGDGGGKGGGSCACAIGGRGGDQPVPVLLALAAAAYFLRRRSRRA